MITKTVWTDEAGAFGARGPTGECRVIPRIRRYAKCVYADRYPPWDVARPGKALRVRLHVGRRIRFRVAPRKLPRKSGVLIGEQGLRFGQWHRVHASAAFSADGIYTTRLRPGAHTIFVVSGDVIKLWASKDIVVPTCLDSDDGVLDFDIAVR